MYILHKKNEQGTRLKKFCATRWSSHEDTLGTFILNIETAVETLELLTQDNDKKNCNVCNKFTEFCSKF